MKAAFFEINKEEQEYVKENLHKDIDPLFFEEPIDENNLKKHLEDIQDCDIISVFIYSNITKNMLSELKDLKLVVTRSTGYDHIDVKACKAKKIKVSNVPHYGENTVAEYAFALMLSLTRKTYIAYENSIKGRFSKDQLEGFDLKDKVIGVIGTGNIGKNVMKIAKGFGMKILAYDAYPNKSLEKKYGCRYKEFDHILENSDVITFHVPHLKSTHHMLNTKNIKKLKKGVVIINTSRGPVTQSKALLQGIEKGIISGIGLDTIEEENCTFTNTSNEHVCDSKNSTYLRTLVDNSMLLRKENVIMTPHNAFNTKEAKRRILDTSLENIKFFQKKKEHNLVG